MQNPFVSVIIPTLNEEKVIEDTLKALKNQDYKGKFEIVLGDSFSKDKTARIAKKFGAKVIHTKKRVVAAGRNAGAREARGDIFIFLDADTIPTFNLITELVKAFKNKKVVGATCPIFPLSTEAKYFMLYWIFNQFTKASIKLGNPTLAGFCCAYTKDAFEKIRGYNEELETSEDHDISKRISKVGEIKYVDSAFALTSIRRVKKWGVLGITTKYIKFFVKYHLLGKPTRLDEYKPIR